MKYLLILIFFSPTGERSHVYSDELRTEGECIHYGALMAVIAEEDNPGATVEYICASKEGDK